MAERREQEKPLAPAIPAKLSPFPPEFISHRRQRYLKWCGCSAALLLILAVTILILMLTIFHVKHPTLEIISVKIAGLNSLSNNTNTNPTLAASVSIRNPNAAPFKFHDAAAEVYYDGALVGEGRAEAGEAGPRRARRVDVLVGLVAERLVGVPRFESDLGRGGLEISVHTRVKGVVKITDVVKRSFVVDMKCGVSVDLTSQVVQDRSCSL